MDFDRAQHQLTLNDLVAHLDRIKPDTVPRWGGMTAQHMVEHLSGTLVISNGRFEVKSEVPEAEWAKRKEFLYGEAPFARGIQNPAVTKGKLRYPDIQAALQAFWDNYKLYQDFWHTHPDRQTIHPMFGPLNRDEWLRFHLKHMRHHLLQFGLVEEAPADIPT